MAPPRNILPADPTPHHYKIFITPDFDAFVFAGHVDVQITAKEPQTSITLNYNELAFVKVTLVPAGSSAEPENIPIESIILDETEMRATFPLQKAFSGDAILSIDYTGIINNNLAGFYRSKYTVKGEVSYMGTTQFEAVDARRAIPCWDEPATKAVFEMVITAPSNMTVLSNMPHYKTEQEGEKTRWFFEPTPKMSTYLLAWTIGEFEYIEKSIKKTYPGEDGKTGETLVRVFTPEGKKSQALFSLDVACRVLTLYEGFFESNYILPKVDLLAIPDFAAGAMENWGLITYREIALLCDEKSSASHRQRVAIVVAHELAHQWFGNLVTMQWWRELWLNESFATYMEYWAIEKLFPEWHVFTQFVHDEMMRAFDLDSMRSSHPVEVDVQNAKEIDDIFDAISYSKGGSIVRMAISFIGEVAFQKGMAAYLKHFSFSNAVTEDLWRFLGEAAGKPLAPIMEYWTGKQGYPFLVVASSADQGCIHVTQKRFLVTGDVTASEDETVWKIPLRLVVPEKNNQEILLEERETTIPIPQLSWVKMNSGQTAFCRVLYKTESLLQGLISAIASKKISNLDRLGIISDYHAFSRSGHCTTVDAMRLLSSYMDEDDYTVWSAVVDFESDLRILIAGQGEKAVNAYNTFCCKLYSKAMTKVGYTPKSDENHSLVQLRGLLFRRLGVANDQCTVDHALKLHAERHITPISADLRYTVFSVYLKRNGKEAFEEVKALAETATEAMERAHYLTALASSKVEGVVEDLFQFALSDRVRSQDVIYILSALAAETEKISIYAEQLKRMWSTLGKKLPGLILGRALKYLEYGADAAVATDMENFWNQLDEKGKMGMSRSFQQGIEGLRINAAWAARDAVSVVKFLTSS